VQFARKPNRIAPLGIRIESDLKDISLNKKHISLLNVAPTVQLHQGVYVLPKFSWIWHAILNYVLVQNYFKVNSWKSRISSESTVNIYTDSLRDGIKVAAAVFCDHCTKTTLLPDNASTFTAELH